MLCRFIAVEKYAVAHHAVIVGGILNLYSSCIGGSEIRVRWMLNMI